MQVISEPLRATRSDSRMREALACMFCSPPEHALGESYICDEVDVMEEFGEVFSLADYLLER